MSQELLLLLGWERDPVRVLLQPLQGCCLLMR
jgi:hypothetical protein